MGRKKRDDSFSTEIRPDLQEKEDHLLRAEEFYREHRTHNSMYAVDLLYFPPEKVPQGWVYKWLAKSLLGIPDNDKLRVKFLQGWRPVPATRHPEEAAGALLPLHSEISQNQNVIERRGLLLCEMPEKMYNEVEMIIRKNVEDDMKFLRTAVQELNTDFDPRTPTTVNTFDDVAAKYNHYGRTFGK